jgi:predicted membrane protein DUF2079
MRVRWKELFKSKVGAEPRWDRWDFLALGLAALIVFWVFPLKLKTFYDLGYTSDLFVGVQAARSWLEGRGLLHDNCFGNMLGWHAYFLLLPLGLIAKPFGAPGLLFVLATFAGAAYFGAVRVLRLLGMAGPLAVIAAGVLLASPFSVAFYQEPLYGFHVEDLTPTLCLALFYFLLQQRMVPSILNALVVISIKEDAPIATAVVAIAAGVETWISSSGRRARYRLNWPAIITFVLSVLAVPLLLKIISSQSGATNVVSSIALVSFIGSNATDWLGSSVVRQWVWIMIVGSFGTILLRPYYLLIGVVTTWVAWFRNRNDLLWPPRFATTETLLWCVTLLGFASIARAVTLEKRWTQAGALMFAIVVAAMSVYAQLTLVPNASKAYLLRSGSLYSPLERQQADDMFARYRRESKPEEPVIASSRLLRYVHDRNFFYPDRRAGPSPIWILGDSADSYVPFRISADTINPSSGIRMEDYALLDHHGRFVLLKKKE